MTDEHNPYNPENYNPSNYEIFYLCNKETKEAMPWYKEDKYGNSMTINNRPDDYMEDKYEVISEYSPKIKGYSVI